MDLTFLSGTVLLFIQWSVLETQSASFFTETLLIVDDHYTGFYDAKAYCCESLMVDQRRFNLNVTLEHKTRLKEVKKVVSDKPLSDSDEEWHYLKHGRHKDCATSANQSDLCVELFYEIVKKDIPIEGNCSWQFLPPDTGTSSSGCTTNSPSNVSSTDSTITNTTSATVIDSTSQVNGGDGLGGGLGGAVTDAATSSTSQASGLGAGGGAVAGTTTPIDAATYPTTNTGATRTAIDATTTNTAATVEFTTTNTGATTNTDATVWPTDPTLYQATNTTATVWPTDPTVDQATNTTAPASSNEPPVNQSSNLFTDPQPTASDTTTGPPPGKTKVPKPTKPVKSTNNPPAHTPDVTTTSDQSASTNTTPGNGCMCQCGCDCSTVGAINSTVLEERINKIIAELEVPKNSTSKRKRKLTCAGDRRPSSQGIGALGVSVLVVLVGFIILTDVKPLAQAVMRCL